MGDMLRHDAERLRILLERHKLHSGSKRRRSAGRLGQRADKFVKVMPRDYAKALRRWKLSASPPKPSPPNKFEEYTWARKPAFSSLTVRTAPMRTKERVKHYKEFVIPPTCAQSQASRCMNCGIPYCHNGCPVNNIIPDWNHLSMRATGRMR
jgi:hypothetical protein